MPKDEKQTNISDNWLNKKLEKEYNEKIKKLEKEHNEKIKKLEKEKNDLKTGIEVERIKSQKNKNQIKELEGEIQNLIINNIKIKQEYDSENEDLKKTLEKSKNQYFVKLNNIKLIINDAKKNIDKINNELLKIIKQEKKVNLISELQNLELIVTKLEDFIEQTKETNNSNIMHEALEQS